MLCSLTLDVLKCLGKYIARYFCSYLEVSKRGSPQLQNLNSPTVRKAFGRVYLNKDMSFLRRREEKRLRDHYKSLKAKYPDASVKLRNGKLFLGAAIKDRVDYHNQLF